MGRKARAAVGGWAYHVINRGNRRMRVFGHDGDYRAFLQAMADGLQVVPMRILGWCLMPNHWHLVLWPVGDADLSRFVGWISNTHVRRYNRFHDLDGHGHLYQGRFKSFPIQEDDHLLRVLRYVEANALRAKLVERAEQWTWSSLGAWADGGPSTDWRRLIAQWPVSRPENWAERVNEAMGPQELGPVRQSVNRGRPYGSEQWSHQAAALMDLGHTMRRPGRPSRIQSPVNADAAMS